MKIIPHLKTNVIQFTQLFRQYPLQILLAFFCGSTIIISPGVIIESNEVFLHLFPIFFATTHLSHRIKPLYYLSPLICVGIYYFFSFIMPLHNNKDAYYVYFTLLSIFFIAFISQNWQRDNQKFIQHSLSTLINLFIFAQITSGLLCLMLLCILATANYLFTISFDLDKFYTKLFFIHLLTFIPTFYLFFESKQQQKTNKHHIFIDFLINYIFTPALIIYTFILYAYVAKIVIQFELPKGKVAYLVMPYLALSILLICLQSIVSQPKWQKAYQKLPLLLFVPLILLWVGLITRLQQYGITQSRLLVSVIALLLTLYSLALLLFKQFQYRYFSAIAMITIFIYGIVLNPKKIEFYSQSARLHQQLSQLGWLDKQGKLRQDFNYQQMLASGDEKQKEQYRKAYYLLYHVNLLDTKKTAELYGNKVHDTFFESYKKNDKETDLVYDMAFHRNYDEKIIHLSTYKKLILSDASKYFVYSGPNDEMSLFYINLDQQTQLQLNIAEFVQQYFAKQGLDPHKQLERKQLDKLTNEILTIKTENRMIIIDDLELYFNEQYGYLPRTIKISAILEK